VDITIRWYDSNAKRTMRIHFRLRGVQLVLATLIPISQVFDWGVPSRATAAALAGGIAVCQGFDSLHHYGEHYVGWRSTAQRLLRERLLFSVQAGGYSNLPALGKAARELLAANVSAIEAQESQSWQSLQAKDVGPVSKESQPPIGSPTGGVQSGP
jgi:hypothetical protein